MTRQAGERILQGMAARGQQTEQPNRVPSGSGKACGSVPRSKLCAMILLVLLVTGCERERVIKGSSTPETHTFALGAVMLEADALTTEVDALYSKLKDGSDVHVHCPNQRVDAFYSVMRPGEGPSWSATLWDEDPESFVKNQRTVYGEEARIAALGCLR